MYACLAVTCHLHFWQNDRDFLRATVVTRGWNGYRNKSQHRKSTDRLRRKFSRRSSRDSNPRPFNHRVRCSNHWAIPAPSGRRWQNHVLYSVWEYTVWPGVYIHLFACQITGSSRRRLRFSQVSRVRLFGCGQSLTPSPRVLIDSLCSSTPQALRGLKLSFSEVCCCLGAFLSHVCSVSSAGALFCLVTSSYCLPFSCSLARQCSCSQWGMAAHANFSLTQQWVTLRALAESAGNSANKQTTNVPYTV